MERLLSPEDEALQRKVRRSTFVTRLFILVAIAVGGACLFVLVNLAASTNDVVTSVRAKQNSNAPLLQSIQDLAEQINSCTDPEGECAKRGAKATGAAIASINQYGLYVVTCADQPGQQTEVELRTCADRLQAMARRDAGGRP